MSSTPRPASSDDPPRERLKPVRRGLLRLHKALVDAERAEWERARGGVTGAQFLQALIADPSLAWLRPFSGLIVEIDEARHADEPPTEAEVRALLERAHALVRPDEESDAGRRYAALRDRDPDVLVLHLELTGALDDALGGG